MKRIETLEKQTALKQQLLGRFTDSMRNTNVDCVEALKQRRNYDGGPAGHRCSFVFALVPPMYQF